MDRKKFIRFASISSLALIIPSTSCVLFEPKLKDVLRKPMSLSKILEDDAIDLIGKSFMDEFSNENQKNILEKLLLGDNDPKLTSISFLTQFLKDGIAQDFKMNNIVVIRGWILSITEARQCALHTF